MFRRISPGGGPSWTSDNCSVRLSSAPRGEVSHQPLRCWACRMQDYTLTLYMTQFWRDERLAQSSAGSSTPGADNMTLSGDFGGKIWLPDTYFSNDMVSVLHDVTEYNRMIRLFADGSVVYGLRSVARTASQHQAAVNDAQQIWPPLIATRRHLSRARFCWRSVVLLLLRLDVVSLEYLIRVCGCNRRCKNYVGEKIIRKRGQLR